MVFTISNSLFLMILDGFPERSINGPTRRTWARSPKLRHGSRMETVGGQQTLSFGVHKG